MIFKIKRDLVDFILLKVKNNYDSSRKNGIIMKVSKDRKEFGNEKIIPFMIIIFI